MLTKLDKLRTLRRIIGIHHRYYSAQISTDDLEDAVKIKAPRKPRRKVSDDQQSNSDNLKMSRDMRQHFSIVEKKFVLSSYPESLLKKKTKLPTGLYNTCPNIARAIVDEVKKDLPEDRPILEVNPGTGTITNLLLRETKNDLFLYEPEPCFHPPIYVSDDSSESRQSQINSTPFSGISNLLQRQKRNSSQERFPGHKSICDG